MIRLLALIALVVLLKKGEVCRALKGSEKIFFSKDVAETLGVESAIILELYQTQKISPSNDLEAIKKYLVEVAPLLDQKNLEENINKLVKYKFINAIKKIGGFNVQEAPTNNSQKNKITSEWNPSKEAIEILQMSQIEEDFYYKKLQEFKLYWIERGQERNNWNTSYIDYIRREWAKEKSSNKGLPYVLDTNWTPSDDVFDILELSEISKESASRYLREFILYWKENGSAFTTWNSKFIEHVKRRHLGNQNQNNEESKKHSEPGKYSKDFSSRKGDSSWASEIEL